MDALYLSSSENHPADSAAVVTEPLPNAAFLQTLMRAVERSNDAILITEAEPIEEPGPRVLYVNPAFERMTGYSAEEMVGKTPRLLQGPNTDRTALARIWKALQAWQPVREELINYRKDGSEFWVEISMVPVADDCGRYTHWFAIQRDTTEHSRLRRELRATNVLLRTMTESVPQLLWTADADGRREWVSEQFAEFVGAREEDCLGESWLRYVHPDDRAVALARLQAFRQLRKVCTAELRLRHRSGKYVWFLKQAAPRFAADGSVSKWIGSFTDISDRKDAEAALRRSEERLRLGIKIAKLALVEIDYTTGLCELSQEAAAIYRLGNEAMAVPREALHATFHPADQARMKASREESMSGRGPGWYEADHRIVWPGGEVRWLRTRKQDFFEGEGHLRRPVRAMLAVFDITESKQVEAAVRQCERRFISLAEGLPQFTWVADAEGRTNYCNRRCLDYVGMASYEGIENLWEGYLHPDDRALAIEAWRTARRTETPWVQQCRLRRHDGEYRQFLARAVPILDEEGKLDQWLGSLTDVQECGSAPAF